MRWELCAQNKGYQMDQDCIKGDSLDLLLE